VYEIKKFIHDLSEQIITDEAGLGRMITKLSSYIGPTYEIGSKFLSTYLNRIDVTLDTYQSAILALLEKGLLENYGWGLICPDCQSPQVMTVDHESSFYPPSMTIQCPVCRTQMDWCLVTRLCDELREACWYRDGLIALAIGWYLSGLEIDFESNVMMTGGECDIIIPLDGLSYIIELKMLWNKNHEKTATDFLGGFNQLRRNISESEYHISLLIHNSICTSDLTIQDTGSNREINIISYLKLKEHLKVQQRYDF
jgi:hypothetical protein